MAPCSHSVTLLYGTIQIMQSSLLVCYWTLLQILSYFLLSTALCEFELRYCRSVVGVVCGWCVSSLYYLECLKYAVEHTCRKHLSVYTINLPACSDPHKCWVSAYSTVYTSGVKTGIPSGEHQWHRLGMSVPGSPLSCCWHSEIRTESRINTPWDMHEQSIDLSSAWGKRC